MVSRVCLDLQDPKAWLDLQDLRVWLVLQELLDHKDHRVLQEQQEQMV